MTEEKGNVVCGRSQVWSQQALPFINFHDLDKWLFLSEPQLLCLHNRDNSNVYLMVLHAYKGEMGNGLAQGKAH